ncbi:response regulator [Corallococcus llansteffanensis]|uniref:Response regulator n=1 Tax=Corallococcus llansteffanensis TaxID=2316731 RepID=A0A3A8Q7W3_9BACT|nr:response regulator [Corallococcus llansteffanensis]RKH63631.1 response regulator [Corallococcus llansteffanensis]
MNPRYGTILLVEDNADDVDLSLIAFERAGLSAQVVVARDGVEALDYLFGTGSHAGRDVREQPRVVLLDLNLPKVSGQEVLQRMRADARTREVPVVVLTSSLEERDLRESYRNFANSYVRKPVSFEEFIEVTRQLGVYWTTLNRAMAQGEVV